MDKYKEWIRKYPGITFLFVLGFITLFTIGFCIAPAFFLVIGLILMVAVSIWAMIMLIASEWDG